MKSGRTAVVVEAGHRQPHAEQTGKPMVSRTNREHVCEFTVVIVERERLLVNPFFLCVFLLPSRLD